MAVFLINICKFNGCGITFPSLGDLIQHIEDTHIDNDPYVLQQKELSRPQCIPLSYALRFITDAARKEGLYPGSTGVELKRKLAIKHHSYSLSSNRSTTPIGSDIDDDEMEMSESDSNDSWTTEEFSSEFIMKYGSRHSGSSNNGSGNNEKPFACPVPGCKKRYKNVNGIKYHSKNGHKKDGKIRKSFKCYCGKSYKTSQGLKSHSSIAHNPSAETGSTSPISISVTTSSLSSSSSSISSLINSPITSICGGDLSSSSNSSNQSNNTSTNNNINTSSNSNSNNISTNNNNGNNNTSNCSSNANSNTVAKNNNYNLIAIKTTNPTLMKAQSGKKLFKIIPDESVDNNSKLETSTIKMTLPNLMNLGILTPATSPSQIQQQQNQIVQNNHFNNNNENSGCSTMPLTPISPNMNKNINFVTSNEITIITQQT